MKNTLLLTLLFVAMPMFGLFEYDNAIYKAQQGDWHTARATLEKLVVDAPDNPQIAYDAGVASYKTEDYESALHFFDIATRAKTIQPQLKEQAHFNAGNVHLKNKEWDKAIESYQSSLSINKDNERAKHNLAYAQQMKQQEEEQKKSDDDESKKDSQDQEKQDQDNNESNNDKKQNENKNNKDNSSDNNDAKNNDQENQDQSQSDKKDQPQNSDSQKQKKQPGQNKQNQKGHNQKQESKQDSGSSGTDQQSGSQDSQEPSESKQHAKDSQRQPVGADKDNKKRSPGQDKNGSQGIKGVEHASDKKQQGVAQTAQERKEQWIAQLLATQEKADQAMNKVLIRSAVDKQCGEESHEENSW